MHRAAIEHLTGQSQAALTRLTKLADSADLSSLHCRSSSLALARLHREAGDVAAAKESLTRAWRRVAGEDAVLLPVILECLLEGAVQTLSTAPVLAAHLVGLVQAHRGPFLLGPFYDPDDMVATLRGHLGDAPVDVALEAAATRELPEDPDWDVVLESLLALGSAKSSTPPRPDPATATPT